MLHIIPNRKLHTISVKMAHNVAVYTVGPLNSADIGFGRSTVCFTCDKNLMISRLNDEKQNSAYQYEE